MAATYLRTITGRKLWLADPVESEIDIRDIAHGLALCNRFAGHTVAPYSVAQHSVMMARVFDDPVLRRWALMHDATEAFIGDATRPLKAVPEMDGYAILERRLMGVIARRFGLDGEEVPEEVKRADLGMLLSEQRDLVPGASSWRQGSCLYDEPIKPWPWWEARAEFLREARACGFAVPELDPMLRFPDNSPAARRAHEEADARGQRLGTIWAVVMILLGFGLFVWAVWAAARVVAGNG